MKRADMITQLVQLLVLAKNNDFGYTETAEEMLSLVEDRGMIPPPALVDTGHGEYLTSYWEDEETYRVESQ